MAMVFKKCSGGGEHDKAGRQSQSVLTKAGGRGGIRTHGSVAATPDFESGAFNHSATLPLHLIGLRNIAVLNSSPLTILRSLRERSENRKRIGVAADAGIEPRPLRTIRLPLCLPS